MSRSVEAFLIFVLGLILTYLAFSYWNPILIFTQQSVSSEELISNAVSLVNIIQEGGGSMIVAGDYKVISEGINCTLKIELYREGNLVVEKEVKWKVPLIECSITGVSGNVKIYTIGDNRTIVPSNTSMFSLLKVIKDGKLTLIAFPRIVYEISSTEEHGLKTSYILIVLPSLSCKDGKLFFSRGTKIIVTQNVTSPYPEITWYGDTLYISCEYSIYQSSVLNNEKLKSQVDIVLSETSIIRLTFRIHEIMISRG